MKQIFFQHFFNYVKCELTGVASPFVCIFLSPEGGVVECSVIVSSGAGCGLRGWVFTVHAVAETFRCVVGIPGGWSTLSIAALVRTGCSKSGVILIFNAPVSRVVRGVRLKVQAITRIHQAPTSWHILLYTPDVIHIKLGTRDRVGLLARGKYPLILPGVILLGPRVQKLLGVTTLEIVFVPHLYRKCH